MQRSVGEWDKNLKNHGQNVPNDLLPQLGFLLLLLLQYFKANNSVAAVFNMLATGKLCGNISYFGQSYQPAKIILEVLILMNENLVAASFDMWIV